MYSTRAFCKKRPEFGHCVSQRRNVITLWRNVTSWRHVHGDWCVVVTSDTSGLDYPFNWCWWHYPSIVDHYPPLPSTRNWVKGTMHGTWDLDSPAWNIQVWEVWDWLAWGIWANKLRAHVGRKIHSDFKRRHSKSMPGIPALSKISICLGWHGDPKLLRTS